MRAIIEDGHHRRNLHHPKERFLFEVIDLKILFDIQRTD